MFRASAAAGLLLGLALLLQGCGGAAVAPTGAATTPPPTTPPASAGLTQRPSNTTCLAGDSPSAQQGLAVKRAFASLSFESPVALVQAPHDTARWYVVEQAGTVRAFANDPAASTSSVMIDLHSIVTSGGETGLLGIAFHPAFPTDPRVYLSYTTGGSNLKSHVSEFRSRDGGATLDPASEKVLLSIDQPAANHNGGNLVFGPDGFLYAGFGDGGGGGDPWGTIGNGQSLTTLLGKMLRIDVDHVPAGASYGIPADNPFAGGANCSQGTGTANCPEIYAYGFRNPWRWSFDRQGGALWVADVGQDTWEEVDKVVRGGNYGWRCREGAHAFNGDCGPARNLLDPIAEYDHSVGQSITGGFVYRGSALPSLQGKFVFADFISGRLWSVPGDTAPTLQVSAGLDTGLPIASFAQEADGELLIVAYDGTLHRLVAGGGGGGGPAAQLSGTGCVDATDPTRPAAGLIPYAPNAAFWSDGAAKSRWLAVPDNQKISITNDQDWDLPVGSVLVKTFSLAGKPVETRLFMHHNDGTWAGYTYEWNAQGTDAMRVSGGKTVNLGSQQWIFPSEAQCLQCHTEGAGRSLGLTTAQLNGALAYPSTGKTANQVVTLNAIGLLAPPVTADPSTLPVMPDPQGSASLSERARAYLDVNCSQCHRPGGGTPSSMDLRYATALNSTGACNQAPRAGDLGIANARLLAPGSSATSLIIARANRRDAQGMPPVGSARVDTEGVALLSQWIDSLPGCN